MKTISKVNPLVFFLYLALVPTLGCKNPGEFCIQGSTQDECCQWINGNQMDCLPIDGSHNGGRICVSIDSQCVTVGGNDIGLPCKFPFKYDIWDDIPYASATIIRWLGFHKEMEFENCTSYSYHTSYHGRPWCATKITSNNRYISGHWGECPDTLGCSLEEGAWLPWSNWSQWSKCSGGKCGIPNVLPERWGSKEQTRTRQKFSRGLEKSYRSNQEVTRAIMTQKSLRITKKKIIETQKNTNICSSTKCTACMLPLCTSCDISGTETKAGEDITLVECTSRCLNDETCLGIEFGKGGRKGECYLNHDQNVKFKSHAHFDGWSKSTNCRMTVKKGNIASNCTSAVIFCQEKNTVDNTSEKEVFRETAKSIEEKPKEEEKNAE